MANLDQEAGILGASLVIYGIRHKLPRNLFFNPDHVAISTEDISEFGQLVRDEVAPKARELSCTEQNWQFVAAARLKGRLAIYDLGMVEWIAVEESKKPHDVNQLRAVFYHDSLETVRSELYKRGIRSVIVPEKNSAHIDVEFDPPALAFRLTDTPLSEITENQIDSGEAVIVNLKVTRH